MCMDDDVKRAGMERVLRRRVDYSTYPGLPTVSQVPHRGGLILVIWPVALSAARGDIKTCM